MRIQGRRDNPGSRSAWTCSGQITQLGLKGSGFTFIWKTGLGGSEKLNPIQSGVSYMKITPLVLGCALLCVASAVSQTGGSTGGAVSGTTGSGSVVWYTTTSASNPSKNQFGIQTNQFGADLYRTNRFLSTNALFSTTGLPSTATDGPPTRLFGPPLSPLEQR
jgi:hypothetical protein